MKAYSVSYKVIYSILQKDYKWGSYIELNSSQCSKN